MGFFGGLILGPGIFFWFWFLPPFDHPCHLKSRVSLVFQNSSKWLNKETEIKYCSRTKNIFTLAMSFAGSYTEDEQNFPRQNNLILQQMGSGVDKIVNFKDFSRPNKEIKYFSRTLTEFKDFSRWLPKFKTFSRLYQPWLSTGHWPSKI